MSWDLFCGLAYGPPWRTFHMHGGARTSCCCRRGELVEETTDSGFPHLFLSGDATSNISIYCSGCLLFKMAHHPRPETVQPTAFLTIVGITENNHVWPCFSTGIALFLISHLVPFWNLHIELRMGTVSENTGLISLRCLCMWAWSNYLRGAEIMIRNDYSSTEHFTTPSPACWEGLAYVMFAYWSEVVWRRGWGVTR